MTLEKLLMKEDDGVILDIYTELSTSRIPATGYAHAYVRKINQMIDAGDLCTLPDKYRKIYLPTLSKMVFKEMSRRYAQMLYNQKTVETPEQLDMFDPLPEEDDTADIEEPRVCVWCSETFDRSEVHMTDIGLLCDTCITAIRSRGEKVAVYD